MQATSTQANIHISFFQFSDPEPVLEKSKNEQANGLFGQTQ